MTWLKAVGALCFGILLSGDGLAAVSLAGTRLIFDGRDREVSIQASNGGAKELLLQAWLSAADELARPEDLPFVVTPHLVHLPAQGKQTLRLLYEGVGMPEERESLLHLYVMEIPRRSDAQQQLTIAVRQRINVFYRPPGLRGNPADAAHQLLWQQVHEPGGEVRLHVSNPTAFHVSLLALKLDGLQVRDDWLIKPGEATSVPLAGDGHATRLSFKALTDYGGQRAYCAQLTDSGREAARLMTRTPNSVIGKC